MRKVKFLREEITAKLKKNLRESGIGVTVGGQLITGDIAVKFQIDTYPDGQVVTRAFYNGESAIVSPLDFEPVKYR